MYTIKYEKGNFYLYIDNLKMYRVKYDERLISMLEGTYNNSFPIKKDMVELNTFAFGDKNWFGTEKRETLYILK